MMQDYKHFIEIPASMLLAYLHVHGTCTCPSCLSVSVLVRVHVCVCINAGMPDCLASDQSGTRMKKN
jgi:hypothetical protein